MKIKENIRIKQIGDESILVSHDGENMNYTRVISLNKSAEFLIAGSFGADFTVQGWAERLTGRYGIDKTQAVADAQVLADKLMKAGVIYE
ncbi:PqqD family peptide modification chaperone [Petrimonas sulfuriphila]|uniref:PqqD family peptide modification chaperone n=1 Tax=Petrimonas sulfuriphila TaxID=285070 RepID=UPI003EBD8808